MSQLPAQSEDVLMKGYDLQVLRRIIEFSRPYQLQLFLSLVLMLLATGALIAGPYLVKVALDEQYPDDQATGFNVGELRGWFWVEFPPGE